MVSHRHISDLVFELNREPVSRRVAREFIYSVGFPEGPYLVADCLSANRHFAAGLLPAHAAYGAADAVIELRSIPNRSELTRKCFRQMTRIGYHLPDPNLASAFLSDFSSRFSRLVSCAQVVHDLGSEQPPTGQTASVLVEQLIIGFTEAAYLTSMIVRHVTDSWSTTRKSSLAVRAGKIADAALNAPSVSSEKLLIVSDTGPSFLFSNVENPKFCECARNLPELVIEAYSTDLDS